MKTPLRVAIVGARGIGKHHAKWFARAGCQLTALYGTSAASVAAAAAAVRDLAPFEGRLFSDWGAFIEEGDFDAVGVCSPAEAHHANVLSLARAGKHILCEKPLVWDWSAPPDQLIRRAEEMLAACRSANVILAVNAQYPAGIPAFEELHRRVLGREATSDCIRFAMDTRGTPRSDNGAAEVWVDLGPHPLALVDAVAPGGEVCLETLQRIGDPDDAGVRFDWRAGERVVHVEIMLRRRPGRAPVRRVGNGRLECEYEGRNQDGEFVAVLRAGGQEWTGPDFMRTSVERFVGAVEAGNPDLVLTSGAAAVRQQRALVGIWARCWQRAAP